MKLHKQFVFLEMYNGDLEIISFHDPKTNTYGVDIYYMDKLVESTNSMKKEPLRDYLISMGFNFIIRTDKSYI